MEIRDRCKRNQDGMFTVRKLNLETEFSEMSSWFSHWKFPTPPLIIFPETTFVLESEGIKICAAALYQHKSSPLASTEWYIINPQAPRELRQNCISKLVLYICDYAKNNGSKFMFSSTTNTNLIKTLESCGYQTTDKNVTNLLKGLL